MGLYGNWAMATGWSSASQHASGVLDGRMVEDGGAACEGAFTSSAGRVERPWTGLWETAGRRSTRELDGDAAGERAPRTRDGGYAQICSSCTEPGRGGWPMGSVNTGPGRCQPASRMLAQLAAVAPAFCLEPLAAHPIAGVVPWPSASLECRHGWRAVSRRSQTAWRSTCQPVNTRLPRNTSTTRAPVIPRGVGSSDD